MYNVNPVYPLQKEIHIKEYIRGLGYDDRTISDIFNTLTITPDVTTDKHISDYSKIRLMWSFVKAGYIISATNRLRFVNEYYPNFLIETHLNVLMYDVLQDIK
jgi:hypothetical protein